MYSEDVRKKAEKLYIDSGLSCRAISDEMGISKPTIWQWYRKHNWKQRRKALGTSRDRIAFQLGELAKGTITESKARKIAMLSKALSRLEKADDKAAKEKAYLPTATFVDGNFDDKIRDYEENHLREYQRRFTQDDSRFRCILKARQIGMSYTIAFEMLKNGLSRRVDQNLISTSLYQTENTLRYARQHMKRLGIEEKGKGSKQEIVLPGDVCIRTLPANQATSQGWPGDVYFDEMAWYRHSKSVWDAIVPSVTSVKGRVTCLSTPYEAGPHNHFWVIATNDGDQYPLFSRHRIDIHDAMKQGLEIDVEELESLFDSDTWERLYLCKFFTDEDSFFSLSELNACRGDCLDRWIGEDRRAGWDIAKRIDNSELVGVEKLADQVFVRGIKTWKKLSYDRQRERLYRALEEWKIRQLHIDETGVGNAVRDFVQKDMPRHVRQSWHTFTQSFKAGLAQNLKKIVEDKRIVIPADDRVLISQFLNIKRQATSRGISYDIPRNADGHGDRFWALALACSGLEFGKPAVGIRSGLRRKVISILEGFRG